MIENLCFEGGGVLGFAYLGALTKLEELDILPKIQRYAGSSIGAACAAALACNASVALIKTYIEKMDLKSFTDGGNFITMLYRLYNRNGLYKGQYYLNWVRALLYEATGDADITFQKAFDKYRKMLIITGTSLNTQKTFYFSKVNYPNMKISDAVSISGAFPLIFQDVRFDNQVFVDGGLLDNFPIHVFDSPEYGGTDDYNEKTLGLQLVNQDEIEHKVVKINKLPSFIVSLINTVYNQANLTHHEANDSLRTIMINIGKLSSLNFDLTGEEKQYLITQGYDAVENYYKSLIPTPTRKGGSRRRSKREAIQEEIKEV